MLWTKLSQPVATVQGAERRRQSYLLAALVLVMIPCIILTVSAWVVVTRTPLTTNAEASIGLLAALALLVPYALARQGRFELGAGIAVVVLALALYGAAVPTMSQSELRLLMWLIIPIFITSVFLSLRATLIVFIAICAAMLAFPLLVPDVPLQAVLPGPLGFIVFMSSLIVLFTIHRNALEADRQAQLVTRDLLLGAVTEGMMDVITQTDAQGNVVYLSPSNQRLSGYDPADLIGKPFPRHLIHPDDVARIDAVGKESAEQGIPARYEYRFMHADGHYLWLETIGHRVKWDNHSDRVFLVTRDITERKAAQERLKQQNELLQTVFDRIPVMIALYDADLNFKLLNRAHTDVLGWSLNDTDSLSMIKALYPDSELRQRVIDGMRKGWSGWNDVVQMTRRGEQIDTSWANVLLSDGSGIGIGQDISQRKKAEVALQSAYDDLEQQVAARTAELSEANAQLQEQIRQREQAERRLVEEHTLIRTLFDIMPDLLYVKDRDSHFVLANQPLAQIFGVGSPDQMIGRSDFDFLPREMATEFYTDEQKVISTGVPLLNKEEATVDSSGEVRWFLTSTVPLFDSASQITGIVGVSRDITVRREAEAALRRLNEKLEQRVDQRTAQLSQANMRLEAEIAERTQAEVTLKELADALEQQARLLDEVLSATPELFAMLDREGRFLYLNPPALKMLGLTVEESHRQSWRDLNVPDEFGSQLAVRLERVFATGVVDIAEQRIGSGTGTREFESILSPIHDLSGAVVAAVMTNRDVTAHKQTEFALRASEERYRIISELISDYAYSFNVHQDGTIMGDWTTESFTRVTGYPVDHDINRGSYTLYHPDDAEAANDDVKRVLQGQAVTGEYRIIRRDGVLRWLRIHRQPVWDPKEGRVVQYYGVATDVTEEKQVAREKLIMELERERLSLMSRFVLAVSHDFRTSLANIETSRYLIGRMLSHTDLDRVASKLATIHECVDHLTAQLENFSTVSFLANPNLRLCDINPLMTLLADEHRRLADERSLTLTVSLADDLPPVKADEEELKRAIRHLIMNALNYTLAGGSITLSTYVTANQVAIEVRDTGLGIEPDHLAHIFDLFYRADPARAVHSGGVGLGLSIVKMVAEAHSGRVMVDSTAGKGSVFTFLLPIAQPVIASV